MIPKQLFIQTFGCQMNEYDSKKMLELMHAKLGFVQTQEPENASLLLINTCSVREKAQEKLFSQLGMWKKFKEKNPQVMIGVGGCVASQEGEAILSRAPYVDIIFGPQTLHRLPELYQQAISKNKYAIDVSFPEIEKFDHLPKPQADGPSAFVSIMEGCNKYCSFCIVPYTRGEEISRPFDDVLAEAAILAEAGVREITLLGQNVNDYRGSMSTGETADLALLISYIATIEGIERIRFMTSHPLAFSDSLIEAYAEIPKLANHLHLPVQSGSDRILSLMKRGYTIESYKQKIAKLKAVRPTIKITSDFIVGFPTETEKDFQNTLDLLDWVQFDQSFSFLYSPRPGTQAASMKDDTPLEIRQERLYRLQNKLRQFADAFSREMVGTSQNILVTSTSKKSSSQLSGRTECNRTVNFEGPQNLIGQLVKVSITEALPNSLRARIQY